MLQKRRLERLVPRYPLFGQTVFWDVQRRSLVRRKVRFAAEAFVVDISVDGALITTLAGRGYAVGDVVAVRLNGVDGEVVVRHWSQNGDVCCYGIQWLGPVELRQVVEVLVEQARGDVDGKLRERWEGRRW